MTKSGPMASAQTHTSESQAEAKRVAMPQTSLLCSSQKAWLNAR
eukprot:CAMPEP_0204083880 /NCGR_PEP_ID=MMETSP0360-20130528/179228_1 /ASSEMBLY_ACC=CAM_ASM_000342 /TAXON_ID=268821 /ORGANISM="Scrippsiella Hangoei, Strain SHTV-5" /LENGTH=43 /DNA_ID= /DNA_START= /DNA_END= /DNA_ORIENTATION=